MAGIFTYTVAVTYTMAEVVTYVCFIWLPSKLGLNFDLVPGSSPGNHPQLSLYNLCYRY